MWKRCLYCQNLLILNSNFWHKDPGRKDGWDNKCKLCKAERRLLRYERDRELELANNAAYRAENADAIRTLSMLRRAKARHNGPHDIISYEVVFERDGGMCGLCWEPIEQSLIYPDPGYGTIDHIKPLSKGGFHTYENVQLAHSWCNSKKGNRE